MLKIWGLVIFAYFFGAIPFGLIVAKFKGVNLRQIGSGNIGATNVYRALGFGYAALVFFLDGLKGFIPTMLILNVAENPIWHVVVGGTAILGHSLTIFAGFKGGRGAATGLGVLLALCRDVFLILAVIAIILILVTRYVAPVTILCCILAPVFLYIFDYPQEYIWLVSWVALFVIVRHKNNIIRLIKGEEHKI